MEAKEENKSEVVRGRVELWTPHNKGRIAFVYPPIGPNTYREVGKKILESNQDVPTGDYTASLLHSAYCDKNVFDEPELKDVRDIMKRRWLWVFNRNQWTEEGVYVIPDLNATGRSQLLNANELEELLKGGEEIQGIRFSQDKRVIFAPKGSYNLGYTTSEKLAKDGFIIASCDLEGAEKLGEVSSKFRGNPYIFGLDIQKGQKSEQTVSAVDECCGEFGFGGNGWSVGDGSLAFGVLK